MGVTRHASAVWYEGLAGAHGPVVYVVDMIEYPFGIEAACDGLSANVVKIPVENWDDSLTPWVAPGLYRGDADFGGKAAETMEELIGEAIPAVDARFGLAPSRRAICGYSLGGLFSFYSFLHSDAFCALGCLSGSVWYEGWLDHVRSLPLDLGGKFAFFSIGSKEKRAREQILHCVQDNMAACADILRDAGCEVRFEVGPGNHMQFGKERFAAGLSALDGFLACDR